MNVVSILTMKAKMSSFTSVTVKKGIKLK